MGSDFGKYRLLATIGRGGMGEVYLAMARGPSGFRKLVVLKCLHATNADDELLRKMFLDEGMIAARLSHQNVVQTYETGEFNGSLYIAMEFLDGQSLSKLMRAVPELQPRLAAHILANALAGLHYAHELRDFDGTPLDIVHRDLSPPNIFLTYDGVVKVVDFGIAKTALVSRTKTEIGTLKGKLAYMSPEQASTDDVDRRADVFSLGVVLWELLTGKRLFGGSSPAVTLKRLLQDEIPRVSSVRPSIDPALDYIVARALRRELDARYATALDMRRDLETYIGNAEAMNWERELGRLLSERFGDHRRKVQEQVQACILQEPDTVARLPSMSISATPTSSPFVTGSEQFTPRAQISSASGAFRSVGETADTVAETPAVLPVGSRNWIVMFAAAVALLGLAAFAGHQFASRSAGAATHSRSVRPAQAATATPAVPVRLEEDALPSPAPSATADAPVADDEALQPPPPMPAAEDALRASIAARARVRGLASSSETKPSGQPSAPSRSRRLFREDPRKPVESVRTVQAAASAQGVASVERPSPGSVDVKVEAKRPVKARAQLVPDLPRSKLVE
jgi:serine/threonine-protein kinase